MHFPSLLAVGLAGCFLAGCGGGSVHVIERTPVAARPADQPAKAEDVTPAAQPAFNAPLDFPPNYRRRIAAHLAIAYQRDSDGPAEITEPTSSASIFGASTRLCVRFPYRNSSGRVMHQYQIVGFRGATSLGKKEFTSTKLQPYERCSSDPYEPFVELDEMARMLEACRARGQRKCVVNEEPNRKDTVILPAARS